MERGHEVSARIDPAQKGADAKELTEEIARGSDMAIEFSHAEAVLENARTYARLGLSASWEPPAGTAGWTS